jgi:hypothetical protein
MAHAGLRELRVERFGFFPPQLADRPWGPRLEHRLEHISALGPVLPFQLFGGVAPAADGG